MRAHRRYARRCGRSVMTGLGTPGLIVVLLIVLVLFG
jgi:hypothetical protein